MQLSMTAEARLEQQLSPRMIQFYEMLQCGLGDLERLVSRELMENPALERVDDSAEPTPPERVDDGDGATDGLPANGEWELGLNGFGSYHGTSDFGTYTQSQPDGDEGDDPASWVAAPVSLQDHLRWHFSALVHTEQDRAIGLRIIEDVDDDGYFRGSIGEVCMALQLNIVAVERVLGLVQQLDPAGVGARDLRECLAIQLRWLQEVGRDHVVARRICDECWDSFTRNQYAACARKLRTSEAAVSDAAEFMRQYCHPYPGRQFRVPWERNGHAPAIWPEVVLHPNPAGDPPYLAEVLESKRLALRIDGVYRRLYEAVRNGAPAAEDEAQHVQSCVRRARQFIQNIQQRRETVRRVAQEVANEQAEFLDRGPDYLQPLTRLEIARRLEVHESTVGRAVAGKYVRLPSEQVVSFEIFFDSSQPARLALERLIDEEDKHRPLSDRELADLLQEQGFDVARRTVAKYRQLIKAPPASQRRER